MQKNKFSILKIIGPGLLPILVYVLAEELLGSTQGLIAAIAFSLIELLYTWIKEKIIDRFVLVDLGMILFMGGLALLLDNPILFKLKPAIIELILCLILALSAFTPYNVLKTMTGRYLKGAQIDKTSEKKLKSTAAVLFVLFSIHTLLIVYSALFMSDRAWGFISGILFYLIFGLYFLGMILTRHLQPLYWKFRYKKDEWFNIVDIKGRVCGQAPRTICHNGSHLLHPVIHLHLFNSEGELFLQKRAANKKIQPDKWDTSVGGHVDAGESVQRAIRRESWEELRVSGLNPVPLAQYLWQSDIESELVYTFAAIYNDEVVVCPQEISAGRFWSAAQIEENLEKDIFTPNFIKEFAFLKQIEFFDKIVQNKKDDVKTP